MRVDSLTSLRFFAAFVVFVHHYNGLSWNGGVGHVPAIFPESTIGGLAGVVFFFVLSGFILTWSFKPEESTGSFYWRRIGRIWPSHLAALIPAFLAFYVWSNHTYTGLDVLTSIFLVQNYLPPHLAHGLPINPVSWTLGVEMMFYLLAPFVIRLARRTRLSVLFAASLLGLAAMWAVAYASTPVFGAATGGWVRGLAPVYMPMFLFGVTLAIAVQRGWRPRIHPVVALVPLAVFTEMFTHRGQWYDKFWSLQLDYMSRTVIALFTGVLILACVQRELRGHRGILNKRPLILLGAWSYCFYLVHQTINQLILDKWGRVHGANINIFFLIGVGCVGTVVAWFFYTYVEEPGRRLWTRWMPRRFRAPAKPSAPAPEPVLTSAAG